MTDISMQSMDQNRFTPVLDAIASFFAAWGAARSCASALEFGRRPANDDLASLGIDPKAFASVRLY